MPPAAGLLVLTVLFVVLDGDATASLDLVCEVEDEEEGVSAALAEAAATDDDEAEESFTPMPRAAMAWGIEPSMACRVLGSIPAIIFAAVFAI